MKINLIYGSSSNTNELDSSELPDNMFTDVPGKIVIIA